MQELELEPHAGSLIESLRAFGYTFETAVADLVDNSISADASEIDVILEDEDDLVVAVIDNGCGMSRDEMGTCVRVTKPIGNTIYVGSGAVRSWSKDRFVFAVQKGNCRLEEGRRHHRNCLGSRFGF